MSRRRRLAAGTAVVLALSLAAVMESRVHGQTTTSGSRTGSSSSGGSSSGSSAASVGGGFTGGGTTPGGGFTGGGNTATAGFTGSAGTGGGAGGAGGRAGGGGGSGTSTQVPVSANPFLSTYVNPYSAGMVSTSGTATASKAFGQPTYGLFSTANSGGTTTGTFTGGAGGAGGASGGAGGTASTSGGVGFGYNTYGLGRTYSYAAVPGDTVPFVVHANPQLQTSVSDVLLRSTSFRALEPLKVTVNEHTVTLEGTVGSAKEKRIVEGMVRMTPGVRAVFNRLEISETLPAPKTGTAPIGP